jgi:hypothetical protein
MGVRQMVLDGTSKAFFGRENGTRENSGITLKFGRGKYLSRPEKYFRYRRKLNPNDTNKSAQMVLDGT